MVRLIRRCNRIWAEFSRSFTIAYVDRNFTETLVKTVIPGKIRLQHLKASVEEDKKSALGKAVISGEASDFSKVTQNS